MKKLLLILIFSSLVISQNFVSNVSKVGTTAGEILGMPASARGLALGNAVAGLDADGSVFFWNPAAAASIKAPQVSASYLPWLVDTKFQHFSFAMPIMPSLVIGGFIAAWSMDDMKVRTELEQNGTGQYFDAGDLVMSMSVASQLTDRFSIGLNVKYLQERIYHSTARGMALDFGTLYQTDILNGMKIIATLNNYGTDMQMSGRDLDILTDPLPTGDGNNGEIPAQYSTDVWSLPLNFRFGVATSVFQNDKLNIDLEIDAIHPSNNYEALDMGMEITVFNMIVLRGGLSSITQDDSIEGFSVGAGLVIPIEYGSVIFDYGYRDYGDLGYIQAMTLGIKL